MHTKDRDIHPSSHSSLKSLAFMATVHCLTGCAIGEVLGMVVGTYFNIHNIFSILLSVVLAFFFGYSFTLVPLLKQFNLQKSLSLALASDTISISVMETMDNLIIFFIPGALDAGLNTALFWGSLIISLLVAFVSAFPVNYWLISKGKGHALIHSSH
jgi:hypothetical protein